MPRTGTPDRPRLLASHPLSGPHSAQALGLPSPGAGTGAEVMAPSRGAALGKGGGEVTPNGRCSKLAPRQDFLGSPPGDSP